MKSRTFTAVVVMGLLLVAGPLFAATGNTGALGARDGNAALEKGRIAKWGVSLTSDANTRTLYKATAATDIPAGVCDQACDANQMTSYAPPGTYATVVAGGMIPSGSMVVCDANGAAVVFTGDQTSDVYIAGQAVENGSPADANFTKTPLILVACQRIEQRRIITGGARVIGGTFDANGLVIFYGTAYLKDGNAVTFSVSGVFDANQIYASGTLDGNTITWTGSLDGNFIKAKNAVFEANATVGATFTASSTAQLAGRTDANDLNVKGDANFAGATNHVGVVTNRTTVQTIGRFDANDMNVKGDANFAGATNHVGVVTNRTTVQTIGRFDANDMNVKGDANFVGATNHVGAVTNRTTVQVVGRFDANDLNASGDANFAGNANVGKSLTFTDSNTPLAILPDFDPNTKPGVPFLLVVEMPNVTVGGADANKNFSYTVPRACDVVDVWGQKVGLNYDANDTATVYSHALDPNFAVTNSVALNAADHARLSTTSLNDTYMSVSAGGVIKLVVNRSSIDANFPVTSTWKILCVPK